MELFRPLVQNSRLLLADGLVEFIGTLEPASQPPKHVGLLFTTASPASVWLCRLDLNHQRGLVSFIADHEAAAMLVI